MTRLHLLLTTLLLLNASIALGEDETGEPSAIVEIGAAGEWGIQNNRSSYGPDFAVETTPIEHWLEIEAGVTPLFSAGASEWDADLLFKKPYTLSDSVEFMFGVGPEWEHSITRAKTSDSVNGEAALDFMFWPLPERHFGWYLEPTYGYGFAKDHDQSLGVSVGLLVSLP